MLSFATILENLRRQGYAVPKARTKIAHDIVLKAMSKSGLGRSATVKGGVVMSDFTDDVRRATMDMDIDFVRFSLADEQVDLFVGRLNCLDGVTIKRHGPIVELKQHNYRGKRIHLRIADAEGTVVRTKVDIGVHVYEKMRQRVRNFRLSFDESGAKMTANSAEQVFAEKLKSLLRFGARSERPKDAFDMYYLIDKVNRSRLLEYLDILVFSDGDMRETGVSDVLSRLQRTFSSRIYLAKLGKADVNWLNVSPSEVTARLGEFIRSLS